jgi:hypothetical protein
MENTFSADKLERFFHLQEMKKEMEQELKELKKEFNAIFDETVGENRPGEVTRENFTLKRQVRKTEKYDEERAVKRLEDLSGEDYIETIRRPDKKKIDAAIELGLLETRDVEDLIVKNYSKVLVVKQK